jgi:hypothetical protein
MYNTYTVAVQQNRSSEYISKDGVSVNKPLTEHEVSHLLCEHKGVKQKVQKPLILMSGSS